MKKYDYRLLSNRKHFFTLLCLVAAGTFASAQTIYYQEDFEQGLPSDWEINNDDGGWIVGAVSQNVESIL